MDPIHATKSWIPDPKIREAELASAAASLERIRAREMALKALSEMARIRKMLRKSKFPKPKQG